MEDLLSSNINYTLFNAIPLIIITYVAWSGNNRILLIHYYVAIAK